jgi:hypothetical protein
MYFCLSLFLLMCQLVLDLIGLHPQPVRIKALTAAGAGPVLLWINSCSVFKAPGVVSGFEDMTVVRQTVEQCRCYLGITKHIGPFTEAEVGGDDNTGLLIELAK